MKMSHEQIEKRKNNRKKGEVGEKKSRRQLKLFLPKECIIMNDVVLEISPNYFNQFDHIILSPKGIYIVDTKNWNYEWDLPNDNSEWTSSDNFKSNPNAQKIYHEKNFKIWIKENFPEYEKVENFIKSKIIFLGEVNKNYGDEDTVLKPKHIVKQMKIYATKGNINNDVLYNLAKCIKNAKPLNHWDWIFKHYHIEDRRIIHVNGSYQEIKRIKSIYRNKGFNVIDTKDKNKFEVTNHIELLENHTNELNSYQYLKIQKHERIASYIKLIKLMFFTLIIAYLLNTALSKCPEIIDKANKVIRTTSTDIVQKTNRNDSIEQMSFTVNKNYSYIYIQDGDNIVFKNSKTKKDTQILFFNDKKIIINEVDKKPIEYVCKQDTIKFEVGNKYTTILLNDREYNYRSSVVKYSFVDNKIID
jgi:hypothetical protein